MELTIAFIYSSLSKNGFVNINSKSLEIFIATFLVSNSVVTVVAIALCGYKEIT